MSLSIHDRSSPPCTDMLGYGRAQTPMHVITGATNVFLIPQDPQNQIIDDWSLKITFPTRRCGRAWTIW